MVPRPMRTPSTNTQIIGSGENPHEAIIVGVCKTPSALYSAWLSEPVLKFGEGRQGIIGRELS